MTSHLNKKLLWHLLFWIVMYLYFLSYELQFKTDTLVVIKTHFFQLFLRIGIAYLLIYVLIPKLLHKNKKLFFGLSIIFLVIIAHATFTVYLSILISKGPSQHVYAGIIDRMTYAYGYITTFVSYFTPALILLVFDYYKKEKETASLLEQKRTSELNALKNQLNPHFLFNTLNNLYVLALKKSDKTPEVIAQLSEILDYILYRCNDNFVSLDGEITLLKNYIDLEQVRYGERVEVKLDEALQSNVKIAPLLLLTFLENAYKHGVREELTTAKIELTIAANNDCVDFYIKNTKPGTSATKEAQNREAIGLKNIYKQLDLLYSGHYQLTIEDTSKTYSVNLKIILKDV